MVELLTVDEVAREFRVHPVTVRRHIAAGRLKAVRIGRSVRLRREDVDAYAGVEEKQAKEARAVVKDGILRDGDPLLALIGMYSDPEGADLSTNKRKYIVEALEREVTLPNGL